MSEKAVVNVAKQEQVPDEFEVMGVRVRLVAVPIGIIQDALASLKPPKIPIFHDPDKDRDYENPNDPDYLIDVEQYHTSRGTVSTEAFCMFGIVLLDSLPKNENWLNRIKFMHKRGKLDLGWVDWDDPTDKEFLFKRYVVGTTEVINAISTKTSITEGGIARAKVNFQRTT
jgi:hypothetical protein